MEFEDFWGGCYKLNNPEVLQDPQYFCWWRKVKSVYDGQRVEFFWDVPPFTLFNFIDNENETQCLSDFHKIKELFSDRIKIRLWSNSSFVTGRQGVFNWTAEPLLETFLSKILYTVSLICKHFFFNSLKELLRAKLIECGWKDQLKAHCKGNEFLLKDKLIALLSVVLVWGSLEKLPVSLRILSAWA